MYLKCLLSSIHVFVVDCEIFEIFIKKTLPSEKNRFFRLFVDVDFMTRLDLPPFWRLTEENENVSFFISFLKWNGKKRLLDLDIQYQRWNKNKNKLS